VRIAGVGSFVADRHAHAHPLEIRSIADEIRARGHVHRAEIIAGAGSRRGTLAEDFGIAPRSELYCSVIVHFENDRPIQLEDRYVLPKLAPDYLKVDFSQKTTPYDYLIKVAPLQEAEHLLRAVMPDERTRKLLAMKRDEPCLLMIRRTWTAGQIASVARLLLSRFPL
jgi:GntR family histidine utilization transcriptional repressor